MIAVLSSLVISLALALLCLAIPRRFQRVSTWQVAVVFAAGLALWILGAAFSLGWYPWTNVADFVVAVGAGMLLGRAIPARFWPFFIFLLVMSSLDVAQILLSATHATHSAAQSTNLPADELYANFFLRLPWGKYSIGPFDLLMLAAIGAYWSRQGGRLFVAFVGMAIGFIAAYGILYADRGLTLPLIPFLMLGWLCSIGIARSRSDRSPAAGSGARSGTISKIRQEGQ